MLDDGTMTDPSDDTAADPTAADPAATDDMAAAEKAKISRLEKMIEVPSFVQDAYRRFDEDRKYVAQECIADSVMTDTVITNFILRNQYVLISQIYARNPTVAVQPRPWIGQPPPGLFEFGRTCELVGQRMAAEAGFKETLTGMIQDVQTCSISWLKAGVQQDFMRDPLGARRHNDQLDNIARLGVLIEQYQNGEIETDSAEYHDLTSLSDTVKLYMATQLKASLDLNPPAQVPVEVDPMTQAPDPMTGQLPPLQMQPDPADARIQQLQNMQDPAFVVTDNSMLPEVPYFIGFNLDPVQPEDIRWDWSITRPEDFYNARWVAHRVYMTKDEIQTKWKVQEDELSKSNAGYQSRSHAGEQPDTNPADRSDVEAAKLNDRCAVWEVWEKAQGRRYVWVQGMDRFVANEVPEVVWHKWYPFFPLVFNRVTGQLVGISDVRLQMPLQDEINQKRTHEREAQKAAYPRYVVGQGLLDPDEKAKLETAVPYAVIELKKAEDVANSMKELMTAKFDPLLYAADKAVREIEIMAGIPQQAAGGVGGAEFATEVAVANQQMGVQADRRKSIIEQFIHDVHECLIELSLQVFPEANIKQLVGPDAIWPIMQREQLWRHLHLEIKPGASGKPDKQKSLELWTTFADLANRLGIPVNGFEVFKRILEEMEMPVDLMRYLLPPQMVVPGAGAPGAPGEAGGQEGNDGGAPPMSESGPRNPEQVPNRPTGQTQQA